MKKKMFQEVVDNIAFKEMFRVLAELHPTYKGMEPIQIVEHMVEKKIMLRELKEDVDYDELKKLMKNHFYATLSEWVNDLLHQEVEPLLECCGNCLYREKQDNGSVYCLINDFFVNPLFLSSSCFRERSFDIDDDDE